MAHSLSRRETLGAVAAGLAPKPAAAIPVGVATNDFRDHSNASMAAELKSQGIRLIQLFFTQTDSNYWKYGGRSDLPGMTPERAREIAGIYRSAGIAIHSLAVYTTLIHEDPTERNANLAYFDAMMKIGRHMGVQTFVSEMGHYLPPGPVPRVPYDFRDDVWHTAVATAKRLAVMAEANGATVLLEPFHISLLASAKRTRLFLEEVGSPRIRALLDPANLLEVNDLEEMFQQLEKWIDCIHAKDRKYHTAAGVAAGQGDLDYSRLVTLAAQHTPGVPMIVEYAGTKNYKDALGYLRAAITKAGLKHS
jgi:sugar phosphate isomerase/epimerase